MSSDSDVGMAKTIGVATLSLADCFGQMRPDLVVLTADRYEMLAPASVALALRIPIAHIEGGEISEGAIDDAVRNALTKLSHVHFTSTELARARVIAMGEEDWRVHRTGAAALDHLRRSTLLNREQLETRLAIDLGQPTALITYHPTTIARDTTREADAVFSAIQSMPGQVLFCYPNADAGSRALIERMESCIARAWRRQSLRQSGSRSFTGACCSSWIFWSGTPAAGSLRRPPLRCPWWMSGYGNRAASAAAMCSMPNPPPRLFWNKSASQEARNSGDSLKGMENLYGDGRASERIVAVLASVPLGEELLIKRARG